MASVSKSSKSFKLSKLSNLSKIDNISFVSFEKPDLAKLSSSGFVCVDMHLHSNYSLDSSSSITNIIDAAKKKGCGIAITDHNSISGSVEAFSIAKKEGVLLIPAIEVTCEEGVHILLYFYELKDLISFYDKHLKNNLYNEMRSKIPHKELFKIAKKYNCVVSAAHPFGSGKCGLYKIENHEDLDIVEGLNGSLTRNKNVPASNLKGKMFTAGTDAHIVSYIGNVATCAKAKNVKEFLDSVKSGNVQVYGTEIGTLRRFRVNVSKEFALMRKMKTKEYIRNRLLHLKVLK